MGTSHLFFGFFCFKCAEFLPADICCSRSGKDFCISRFTEKIILLIPLIYTACIFENKIFAVFLANRYQNTIAATVTATIFAYRFKKYLRRIKVQTQKYHKCSVIYIILLPAIIWGKINQKTYCLIINEKGRDTMKNQYWSLWHGNGEQIRWIKTD